ncbi:hypothetical protein [Haladaptatus pallidirubidus]
MKNETETDSLKPSMYGITVYTGLTRTPRRLLTAASTSKVTR